MVPVPGDGIQGELEYLELSVGRKEGKDLVECEYSVVLRHLKLS